MHGVVEKGMDRWYKGIGRIGKGWDTEPRIHNGQVGGYRQRLQGL